MSVGCCKIVELSNGQFNQLFVGDVMRSTLSTLPMQPKVKGSFPDIADFTGGIEKIGSGFSGMVFKSNLRGVFVVLKVGNVKVFSVVSYYV